MPIYFSGLFKQAISQSGNALTHWVWNRDPLGRTQRLAELLECGDNTTSSHDIIKCIRTKPAELVVKKSNVVIVKDTQNFVCVGILMCIKLCFFI